MKDNTALGSTFLKALSTVSLASAIDVKSEFIAATEDVAPVIWTIVSEKSIESKLFSNNSEIVNPVLAKAIFASSFT